MRPSSSFKDKVNLHCMGCVRWTRHQINSVLPYEPAARRPVVQLTEGPEASLHGQQAAPGLRLRLLRHRGQRHRDGFHAAQCPRGLAARGRSAGRTGSSSRTRAGAGAGLSLSLASGRGRLCRGLGVGQALLFFRDIPRHVDLRRSFKLVYLK